MAGSKQAHWQQVFAGKAEDEHSWYQADPSASLALIEKFAPDRSARILDVGAGTSQLADRLLDAGYSTITCLDISAAALAKIRARLRPRAKRKGVRFIEADLTAFSPDFQVDVWHDRAVFHFLTEPMHREAYKRALMQAVPVGGVCVFFTFALGGPTQCSGLDIRQYDADGMKAELGPAFSLLQTNTQVHKTPSGNHQLFACFVFKRIED